jgi:CRP-like cAMP-binding protein
MISPETLRRFPLFGGLQPEMIKTIAMLGEEVSYEQGTWLFREGGSADWLFLVLEGEVELSVGLPIGTGAAAHVYPGWACQDRCRACSN